MRLNEFKSLSPYNFIFESEVYSPNGLDQNKTCIKCKNKICYSEDNYNESVSIKCHKGLNCYIIKTNNQNNFIINGLILENEANAQLRKYKGKYIIALREMERFIQSILKFDEIIENRIVNTIEENFSVFHDIKTTATTVTNCAEKLIGKNEGENFEEKLANSDRELKDLYDSMSLLRDHLNMIDILVNTNKIKYANKRSINIFKLFERLSKILRNNADKKNLEIHWHDNGKILDCQVYPSFQFIPLVLLDNAIKYSFENRNIEIGIYDYSTFLRIKVSSFGDFVDDTEEEKIFDKYYKGRNSINKEGIGMGLWIADQICKAHDGSITYEKNGSGNFGQNVFTVEFPRPKD